jgi:hypothetical protein
MLNPIGFLSGFRRLDRLFQLENKHGALIEAQAIQIQALQERLTRLEARIEHASKSWLPRRRGRRDRLPRWWLRSTSRRYPGGLA